MRRFIFALFLPLLVLTGCEVEKSSNMNDIATSANSFYASNIATEDCYLCSDSIEEQFPSYWGQNNIALISLNTFEIKPLEINRYDRISGQLLEEYAGIVSFGGGESKNGGFSASLMQDYDRGYATGSVDFYNDEVLDISKTAGLLCEDCLNEILPRKIDQCFGVGVMNLATKEIRIFEKCLKGFVLGDFYIDCNLQDQDGDKCRMDVLIFYCPIRYEEKSE